jgi:uncharacterized membrane protein
MKQKSNWLKEAAASLLYLGVFALIRFILISQGANLRINNEVLAIIILAVVTILAVLIQMTSSLRDFFSFSYDSLILGMVGAFFWNLSGLSRVITLLGLVIFIFFTTMAAIKSIQLFKREGHSLELHREVSEIHDFLVKCLMPKFFIMALGSLLIEFFLVPIVAG